MEPHEVSSCDRVCFSILHHNVRSIVNKHDDFVNFLATLRYEFSVIGLTETWLTKSNKDEFSIQGYNFFVGQTRNNNHGVELECMLISYTNLPKEQIFL